MPDARPMRLHVKLSKHEMSALKKVADREGVSVADVVRRLIRQEARAAKGEA